jgi:hypothetical protein
LHGSLHLPLNSWQAKANKAVAPRRGVL